MKTVSIRPNADFFCGKKGFALRAWGNSAFELSQILYRLLVLLSNENT
jgi:hypothetical protein